MKKIFLAVAAVCLFFLIELLCTNLIGEKYTPNLILLLIIYLSLSLGIRYSLLAAVLGGVFKDSFGVYVFGFYSFAFVFSAFMTTVISKWIYQKGNPITLFSVVFLVCLLNLFLQCVISQNIHQLGLVIKIIMLPEILSTLLVAGYVFRKLKRCASRLLG